MKVEQNTVKNKFVFGRFEYHGWPLGHLTSLNGLWTVCLKNRRKKLLKDENTLFIFLKSKSDAFRIDEINSIIAT